MRSGSAKQQEAAARNTAKRNIFLIALLKKTHYVIDFVPNKFPLLSHALSS